MKINGLMQLGVGILLILMLVAACKTSHKVKPDKIRDDGLQSTEKVRYKDTCAYLPKFYDCSNCFKLKILDSITMTSHSSECLGKIIVYFEKETNIKSKASFGFGGYYYKEIAATKEDLINWSVFFDCDTTQYIDK